MSDDVPSSSHNHTDAILRKARELGEAKARGVDTLVQFGLMCVDAAYSGFIDLAKSKHGETMDDAVKLYAEFERGRSQASIFDHKSASGKVQAAKLRTCIKLGGWTRGGPGEPLGVVNKLMNIRRKLRADPTTAHKLDDAYATLLRFARYQIKQLGVVDDPETLRNFCLKSEGKAKTIEEHLAETLKRLDDLRAGKAAGGTLRHSGPGVLNAISALRQEIVDVRDGSVADNQEDDE